MFKTSCDVITNPINCVGVMGAGLALVFKNRYPKMFTEYESHCKLHMGTLFAPYVLKKEKTDCDKDILMFPTKSTYKNRSDYDLIRKGLIYIADNYKKMGISSVAIPALGCGVGMCDWELVLPLINYHLGNLPGLIVEVYPPKKQLDNQIKLKLHL